MNKNNSFVNRKEEQVLISYSVKMPNNLGRQHVIETAQVTVLLSILTLANIRFRVQKKVQYIKFIDFLTRGETHSQTPLLSTCLNIIEQEPIIQFLPRKKCYT